MVHLASAARRLRTPRAVPPGIKSGLNSLLISCFEVFLSRLHRFLQSTHQKEKEGEPHCNSPHIRILFERILCNHFFLAMWLTRFGERQYSSPYDVAIAKHFEMLVDVRKRNSNKRMFDLSRLS